MTRHLARLRALATRQTLYVAFCCAGAFFLAVGCWEAWPPLGWWFTGLALAGCGIVGAYLEGGLQK